MAGTSPAMTEMMASAVGRNARSVPDGKSRHSLDSSSPVPLQKINQFSLRPNHFYKSGPLVPQRGVSRSSRTRSGMRWTRMVLLTNST